MSDDKEFRFGAYSGLFAVIMVVALAVMAMTALDTGPSVQTVKFERGAEQVVAPSRIDSQ